MKYLFILLCCSCGPLNKQTIESDLSAVKEEINSYCDARAKVLTQLGIAGSAAIGIGEAGATQ